MFPSFLENQSVTGLLRHRQERPLTFLASGLWVLASGFVGPPKKPRSHPPVWLGVWDKSQVGLTVLRPHLTLCLETRTPPLPHELVSKRRLSKIVERISWGNVVKTFSMVPCLPAPLLSEAGTAWHYHRLHTRVCTAKGFRSNPGGSSVLGDCILRP